MTIVVKSTKFLIFLKDKWIIIYKNQNLIRNVHNMTKKFRLFGMQLEIKIIILMKLIHNYKIKSIH